MKFVASLIVVLCVALPVAADEIVRTISLTGEAKTQTVPDQALITFTLESKASELADAKRMQDEKLRTLYTLAGELRIEQKHLKTNYAQINPEYRYKDGKQIFQGYNASASITITLNDTSIVGEVMERFVKAGFDRMNAVQYRIKDEQPIREKLKIDAIANAKSKAEKMAAALGMRVGKPVQISESAIANHLPQPFMRAMPMAADMAEGSAMAPPSGEQETHATIHVVFELVE